MTQAMTCSRAAPGLMTLRGGAGADTLDGGPGNDILYGGMALTAADDGVTDTFVFTPDGLGSDDILDFHVETGYCYYSELDDGTYCY